MKSGKARRSSRKTSRTPVLRKTLTGIKGLDQLTGGGLPQGRPTLLCGEPGCGKTLLAMEFLARGAKEFGEPGVFVAFEERLQGRYRIEVVDLLKNPRLAENDRILAIPTLVKQLPIPVRRIIGDLSNTERVLVGLDLRKDS